LPRSDHKASPCSPRRPSTSSSSKLKRSTRRSRTPRKTSPTPRRRLCATAPRPSSITFDRCRRRSIFRARHQNSSRHGQEGLEFPDHALIDRALERHDEVWKLSMRRPSPGVELALMAWLRLQIDLAVLAFESGGEPELRLAA